MPLRTEVFELTREEFLLKHVAPGVGCIIAFLMFASPLKAILQIRKQKHLGDLNPLPLVTIVANCAGWLLYGCVTRDIYVILANEPGLLLGMFMTVTAYGFADAKVRDSILQALMFFTILISMVGAVVALVLTDPEQQSQAAGYTAVGILLCFYAAPLSGIAEVLRTRSSASLYFPSCAMAVLNSGLWTAYGLAIGDTFIWGPNAVGLVFSALQCLLIAAFPAKAARGQQQQPQHDVEASPAAPEDKQSV